MTTGNLETKVENGVEPASQESICESKIYHHIKNKDGRDQCKEQFQDSEPTKGSEDDEDSPYALIIRRRFSEKREVESTTICINSPLLHKAFQEIIGSYPTVASDFKSSFKLESPFQILLHNWDQLEAYRDDADSPRMRQHLNLLIRFMEEEMGPERRTLQHMLQKHMITFKQAWVIYRPGDFAVSYGTSRNRGPYLTVHSKYCDANDSAIGEAQRSVNIFQEDHFASDHPARISRLPIYPRKFCSQGPELETELLQRGQRFVANRGILTKDYDGIAEFLKEPPYDFFHPNMADFPPVWLPFTYATTWNVIILFDEADVFLESRDLTSNSTTRNALVAVFLKHLEYFSGIVFLTTNRLGSIDAAIKSRIHLSLSFGPPAADVRRQIWRQNLEAVPIDETEIGGAELSGQAANNLVHHILNGREISNALNTARTLARFEGAKLNLTHIETVLKVGHTFGKHLET
ncbi:hypothetical protein IL306_010823 [Fusarium sp. DS 682]|nr:hypothetical protein IL306_010823 [Fusarium sp. DS 682]